MRNAIVADIHTAMMGFAPDPVTSIEHIDMWYRAGDTKIRIADLR